MQQIYMEQANVYEYLSELALSGGAGWRIGLIKSVTNPSLENFTLEDVVEADFGGYERQETGPWTVNADGVNKQLDARMPEVIFKGNGKGPINNICGHFVEKLWGDEWKLAWICLYRHESNNDLEYKTVYDNKSTIRVSDEIWVSNPELFNT